VRNLPEVELGYGGTMSTKNWPIIGLALFATVLFILNFHYEKSADRSDSPLVRTQEKILSDLPLEPNLVRLKACSLFAKARLVYVCSFESRLNGPQLLAVLSRDLDSLGWTRLQEVRVKEYGAHLGYAVQPFCKGGQELSIDFPSGVSALRKGDTVRLSLVSGGARCR
jgi:hypothetical protein